MNIQQLLNLAIEHHRAGRLLEAESHYRRILQVEPDHCDALNLLGMVAQHFGHFDAAEDLLRKAVAIRPGEANFHFNLGVLLMARAKWEDAIAELQSAIRLRPDWAEAHNNLGTALQEQCNPVRAVGSFERAIALRPSSAEFRYNHANALTRLGELGKAVEEFNAAIALRPDFAEALNNLGNALCGLDRVEEGISSIERALRLRPEFPEALNNLGNALTRLRRFEEAVAALRRAIKLQPNFPDAHNNLGNALNFLGRFDEAIAAYRAAVSMRPPHVEYRCNLAAAYIAEDEFDPAIDALEQCLAMDPDCQTAHASIASALRATGDVAGSVKYYARAAELNPHDAAVASDRLFTLQFHPEYDAAAILGEHRYWNEKFAGGLWESGLSHGNDLSPDRRLRIGYVSPDFRGHCQALFTEPLFANHDHKGFEVFCYSSGQREDAVTGRLKARADTWRPVAGQTDAAVVEIIRQDCIDILVDLTMHMSGNRLLAFARKPAPVQITWLAYPGTTGLGAIDYRLSDPFLDPPGIHDECYTERSLRLPHTFWCYDPWGMEADRSADAQPLPAPGPLPASQNGCVTFGCLNDFSKISQRTLQLWARAMQRVPGSRLRLLAPAGRARAAILNRLEDLGIAAGRVEFVSRQPRRQYLAEFHRIDLCLDTLPYNGHTTSLDSFWMGVPVLSRVGETVVGRAGWSQLSNLGLAELASHSDDEFVETACALAGDLSRLAHLRRTLRDRMMASRLTDAPRFARDIESAYRHTWHAWCGKSPVIAPVLSFP